MEWFFNQLGGTTHYVLLGASCLGIIGASCYFYSYKKYTELQNLRSLEYKNLNIKLDLVIKEYVHYNKIIEYKKDFITEKSILEQIIHINNLEDKWKNSFLQSNEQLKLLYKKIELLNLNLKQNFKNLKLMQMETEGYEFYFKEIKLKNIKLNKKFENLLDLNLANKYEINYLTINLKDEFNFLSKNNFDDINLRMLHKFIKYRITLDEKAKYLNNLQQTQNNLLNEYKTISDNFMNESNEFLQKQIHFLDEHIRDLTLKEKEFLDVHKAFLPYLNQYKIPKIFMMNQVNEAQQQINLFKKAIWKENEINQQYLNSNHTYFWLRYDEFWTNLKYKIQWGDSLHSLNLVDSKIMVPEYKLTHLDPFELDDLYLRLNVFAVKIFLVTHLDTLKLFIPFVYAGFIGLVSYILYTKIKFWYNCYKTKTVKVTFLNWLLDPEILFTTSKLGIFYGITILVLLGVLYNFSGFGYWFTFMFCGRVFIWNWIKWGIYKLNKKK